jgi:hypothetical protein
VTIVHVTYNGASVEVSFDAGVSLGVGVDIYFCKGKINLSLCLTKHHAIKSYWGNGGIAQPIVNIGTVEVSGQLHAPVALPLRKELPLAIG